MRILYEFNLNKICFLTAILWCPGNYRTKLKTRSRSGEGRFFILPTALKLSSNRPCLLDANLKRRSNLLQVISIDTLLSFRETRKRENYQYLQCHSLNHRPLSLKSIIMAGETD